MKLPRRSFLKAAAGALAIPALGRAAWAQAYPARNIRLLVGFPAGATADIVARLMGQWLSERLGQPVIIENRAGAAGNIATEAVVRSEPDGYTLMWIVSANAISVSFYDNLKFNFVHDIIPVGSVMSTPLAMVVRPDFPAKTIPEFIAYAKANPGKINMASGGNGGTSHVTGELFKMMAGVNLTHVPYRGDAPAATDIIGGQVDVLFGFLPAMIEYIRTGKVRALGVTTAKRSDALPDLPAIAEFVPGYETSLWHGLGAPRNTPAEIVARLNKELAAGIADPTMQKRLAELGSVPMPMTQPEFANFVAQDVEKWRKVVAFAGTKAN
jgi:tripartite-type tricarboxylate transporter receptor subunit TctC